MNVEVEPPSRSEIAGTLSSWAIPPSPSGRAAPWFLQRRLIGILHWLRRGRNVATRIRCVQAESFNKKVQLMHICLLCLFLNVFFETFFNFQSFSIVFIFLETYCKTSRVIPTWAWLPVADGGSSLCSVARGRLSSPDHGRVEAIVTAAWRNWQSPLISDRKIHFGKDKNPLWILGALFLRSEPEISLSFRSAFSSKLGTVYSPTSRILEMAVSMWHGLIWHTVCSTRWKEKWIKIVNVGNMAWFCKFVKSLESALFLYMEGWLAVYQSERKLRQHRFRTFVKRSAPGWLRLIELLIDMSPTEWHSGTFEKRIDRKQDSS